MTIPVWSITRSPGRACGDEGEAGEYEASADLDLGGSADTVPLYRLDDS